MTAKLFGPLGDEVGGADGGGVETDFVGPGPQDGPHVIYGADAATNGEGDEHLISHGAGHGSDGLPGFVGSRDVEEN